MLPQRHAEVYNKYQHVDDEFTPHFVYTLHDKRNTHPIHTHICNQNNVTHQAHNTNHQVYYKLVPSVQELHVIWF